MFYNMNNTSMISRQPVCPQGKPAMKSLSLTAENNAGETAKNRRLIV